MSIKQITDTVLMVRPANFGFNPQTAASNNFQDNDTALSAEEIKILARQEFDQFVQVLRQAGIMVLVMEESPTPLKYDSVFPNNWLSTHQDGTIITYPMFSETRRLEREEYIFAYLKQHFAVQEHLHLEHYEEQGLFLESTGSVILDRPNKVAYACRSNRTSEQVLTDFCQHMGYELLMFTALDAEEVEIYHTNVMMALGEDFVIVCLDAVVDPIEELKLSEKLEATNKTIITISLAQMAAFAGNMLQLSNVEGDTFLVMSEQAYSSLNQSQVNLVEQHTNILYSPLYIIEKFGGGSARCMLSEIFLLKK